MFTKVHHVTYVVASVDQMAEFLENNFGMKPERTENQPKLGYRSLLYRAGATLLDFFEPMLDEKGEAVVQKPPATGFARKLRESGPGVWHVAFGVDHIEQVYQDLQNNGVKTLGHGPQGGGSVFGYKNFSIDQASSGGVFFQLAEGESSAIKNT